MSKFSKNFILCGEIDFFCLLCKESFEATDDVEKHIRWEQHRKLIKVQGYLPKFKKDTIFKLEDKYYCETCNIVVPAFAPIKNHVKEESHKSMIVNPVQTNKLALVKRRLNCIIVSVIAITKKEWHGIVKDHCLFCNITVDNYNMHTIMPEHMIKLIQSKIIKENRDQIYRVINEKEFYCFICKNTFTPESLTDHWTSDKHTGNNRDVTEKIKFLFDIDKRNATATCVVCNETIDWCFGPMSKHKAYHIVKGDWEHNRKEADLEFMQLFYRDKGKLRSQLKKFGQDNFIKLNEGGGKGYCTLCNVYISAHILVFKQHLSGVCHRNFLEIKNNKKTRKVDRAPYKIKPFSEIFKAVIQLHSYKVCLVPFSELCINMLSFTLIAPVHNDKLRCHLCDEDVKDAIEHLNTPEHKHKLFKADVIEVLETKGGLKEFIREIRPGLYHCGVCNKVRAGWRATEKHLNKRRHKIGKFIAHKMISTIVDPDKDTEQDAEVTEQDAKITEQGAIVAEQDAKVTEQGTNVTEQGAIVTEQGVKVTEQVAIVIEQGAKVIEQDAKVTQQGTEVTEQGAKVTQQGIKVAEQGVKVTEQGAIVIEQGVKLAEKGVKVTKQGTLVTEKSANISEQGTKVTEQDVKVTEQGAKVTKQGNGLNTPDLTPTHG